ncbi:butyrophilin-like protein 10 isoform X1 [Sebastes fasciatus]|uniref:butyrophilin-like protein 10 isoform X1 n=1 Tax=Sebastes fasciatus TaxID=394691 RepID=UPI003D9EE2B5
MYYCLLLVASLLSGCSGKSSVHLPPETVLAFAGDDVILPCSFSVAASGDDFPTVEWSKQGLQPNVVLLYRDGCETHEMKNPAFHYRTSLIAKELKNGNISLRISNVQLADAGKYQCMRLWRKPPRDVTAVELVVGAVSEPKLSVTSADGEDVTLQCEANCWQPEPRIDFLDEQGNDIGGDEPKREEDARGCYTVRRRVTLQDAANRYFHHRVTCRVHQPETNQTRDTEILLPVKKSCSLTAVIAVGVTILLLSVALCGLAGFLWRRYGKCAKGQKYQVTRQSSDQRSLRGSSESLHSVKAVRTDNIADITIEMLTTQVADLETKLHEQEDTIRQLQNNNTSQPSAPGSLPQNTGPKAGVSRQDSDPAPGKPVYRSSRRHSSPALLNFPVSTSSEKKRSRIGRSKSDAHARPGQNGKPERRYSSVSNNRFLLLPDLKEESELLLA